MKTIFTSILVLVFFSFSFAQGNDLQATADITNESVQGSADGYIDLTVFGGTTPYDIYWSTEATSEDIGDLSAGTYDVTIVDADSTVVTYSYEVSIEQSDDDSTETDPCQNFYGQFYVTNASEGYNDGSINLDVSGGTSPYSYAWNTGAESEDLQQLAPGHYEVVVTDDNGCQFSISTYVYEESEDSTQQNNEPIESVETNPIDTCFDATIDHAVINGYEIYENTMTISWLVFDEDNNLLGQFVVTYDFTNDSAGVYDIVVSFECGKSTTQSFSQELYVDRAVTTGIVSLSKNTTTFSIYPNPVQNQATINIESKKVSQAQWSIISLTGQVITTQQLVLNAGNNTVNINTSSLQKGVYILQLTQNNQVVSKQFVK